MKFWIQAFIIFIFFSLPACADEPGEEKKDNATVGVQTPQLNSAFGNANRQADESAEARAAGALPGSAQVGAKEKVTDILPPLSKEEERKAERIISFSNQARDILQSGNYAAVETLKDNARHYQDTWFLPKKRPKLPSKHSTDSRLKASSGLFSEAEESQLASALDGMDKALNDIIGNYRELEKYVNDSSIIDDGKKGLELCRKIEQSHSSYRAARKSWMSIVEARSDEAEAQLIRRHPLQRQIVSARNISRQMATIEELAGEHKSAEALDELRQNLQLIIDEAGKPPFQAAPSLERLYRAFLKDCTAYCKVLNRGILEGFHNVQRRELKKARLKCHNAYNEFVKAANKLAVNRESVF